MLADGTDEVLGQRLAFVYISADGAYPSFRLLLLWSGLDVAVIIGVCGGGSRLCGEGIGNVGDKHDMRAEIYLLHHLGADYRIHAVDDIDDSVLQSVILYSEGLVRILAALEAPMPERVERSVLRQNGDIEDTRALNHAARIVVLVDGHRDSERVVSHLDDGVGDTSVVLSLFVSGNDEKSVREFE